MIRALNESHSLQPKYPSFKARFLFALLVAVYIVVEGQADLIWNLVFDPNLYITLLFSTSIAMSLILYIHAMTVLLDKCCPWEIEFNKRLAFQLLLCALVPIFFDLVLVKFYFWLFLYDFDKSGYLVSEFPLAKMLMYLMNVYYMKLYFDALSEFDKSSGLYIEETELPIPAIQVANQKIQTFEGMLGIKKRVFHVNDLVCFKRESGTAKVWLKDNTIWFIDYTTNDFEKVLDSNSFFKINRNVIIAFNCIDSYKSNGKRGEIAFKSDADYDVDKTISRDQYPLFKTAFKLFVERKYS